MVASVEAAARARPDVTIRLLLLQGCESVPAELMFEDEARFATLLTVPEMFSLSVARNQLLAEGRRLGWMADGEIVASPDDDCWYTDGILAHVHGIFASDASLDF
ncbi:hypothetical protein [Aureimonas phyllosphaerae]|uniref:Glycosyl transferase family 2 n=1 Tax=Aureimonas phyllosphaerae TaxID=1166078 RepID=A0A7W6BX60_9HYPH|nr:hypothetical protein [Aureimonas phyllosphaerae]MBB3938030.1 hypothetical protein [Aureimonas phyllosphaerae]MBB3962037.1 hypothetical protein [Aureimonas phyllosphaerae]SFF54120.1 hypothetical protein SAMN05216566_12437 [Aureimonas phyllosphaerae]